MKDTFRDTVYLVDKFFIPRASIDEFITQVKYNRAFVAKLPGYSGGEAFESADKDGNLTIVTIAGWESHEKLNEAKKSIQAEFKRIGFNPPEFYERLDIKMEREQYRNLRR